ncbi:LlaJI family restriction endonuclease [Allofournierella massiliensis]|uniref:LlaJI family restriction endonuclease n=1 Tax=Allofournierella massiliensis TaxID=1650663 RepID=A0ABT7UU23_9FIRM|nr:LlaJI family restriction endonuclease [Fournierella massiliensis]MDM8202383.1 LlaJI family restriction endonuclease [Fournierella massiliensis]
MLEYNLKDKCHINTNWDTDTFVGIRCDNGNFSINFPLGYHLSDDDKSIRKDILLLISTIASTVSRKESYMVLRNKTFDAVGIPIQAYLFIISDYLSRGYYREQDVLYEVSKRGKINWNRTIKTQKPVVQGNGAYYLDFVTKKSSVKENELITQIHEFCVYESFQKMGWLFTASLPAKPRIKYNRKLFRGVILDKLRHTFNDKNKALFRNMLAIIDEEYDPKAPLSFRYGTNRFEYVWEALIDRVYGIEGKAAFFPKTTWLVGGTSYNNASLEPDSIMLWNGNVYVLDAKYYKFGATKRMTDLPESTSINKQITYGEYIASAEVFKKQFGEKFKIYNAFLMPFDANSPIWKGSNDVIRIGESISNWKSNEETYQRIQGIVVDVKHLMRITVHRDESEIMQLAACIESAFEKE